MANAKKTAKTKTKTAKTKAAKTKAAKTKTKTKLAKTKTTKAAAALTADDLKVTVTAAERAGWTAAAGSLRDDEVALSTPIAVLTGESVDVAKFARARWTPVIDEKTKVVTVPGLSSAVRKDQPVVQFAVVPTLHDGTAQEILTLRALTQEAHTKALLSATSSGDGAHPRIEAEEVESDLRGVAESFLDDGVETDEDARLRAVNDAHANDPDTDDALAGALDDYATLVESLRPGIDGYADFSPAWIARARELSAALRIAPAGGTPVKRLDGPLLDARNRLGTLLTRRIRLVRAKARFVFRDHLAIAREATSVYERRRRAERRRTKKAAAKPTTKTG